jgi:hypothetical protein
MARGADTFNRRWPAGLVMARQKFGISRQCETKAFIDVSKWRLKRITGQHNLTKLCFIEPTVNFHAEPSPDEQEGGPKSRTIAEVVSSTMSCRPQCSLLGREPINPEWLPDFRFDTHSGLKSDFA